MSSIYGENIHISIFGQSHSAAIGVAIDGIPAGLAIDTDALNAFMRRRAPGQNEYSTARREAAITTRSASPRGRGMRITRRI